MIVIVIMGTIYTLAIGNFNKLTDKSKSLNLLNLKTYLASQHYKNSAEILCLDNCLECNLFLDGKKTKKLKNFLDNSVKKFRYDFNYGYVEKENKIFFNKKNVEQDVCFSLNVDKNGASEQVLVSYKDKFYDFTPYLLDTKVYNSLSEAKDAKEKLIEEVIR